MQPCEYCNQPILATDKTKAGLHQACYFKRRRATATGSATATVQPSSVALPVADDEVYSAPMDDEVLPIRPVALPTTATLNRDQAVAQAARALAEWVAPINDALNVLRAEGYLD